jgi:DNA-binding MarR family transcriptional regulator
VKGEMHILLARVSRSHHRKSHSYFKKEGITPGQPRILDYLWEHDGCIQRDLAENCNIEPATVTAVMANMERAGLIERRPNPDDRRVLSVWLTNKGRESRSKFREIFENIEKECFEGFTEQEIEQTKGFLERLLVNLTKS